MTTITISAHLDISRTHFETVDEFATYIAEWDFERQLDEGAERIKNKPTSSFINI